MKEFAWFTLFMVFFGACYDFIDIALTVERWQEMRGMRWGPQLDLNLGSYGSWLLA